ncbi:MAG: hypothetical protein RIQ79_2506 [Verrucomicrobiota bacterium]
MPALSPISNPSNRFTPRVLRAALGFALLVGAVVFTPSLHAANYTVSAPHYLANPGTTLRVPVELDRAAGLASVRVQLNYDAQVLTLTTVTAGPLGQLFDFSKEVTPGTLTLDFVRARSMISGNGRLAFVEFTVNATATTTLYSDLAFAVFEVGDETGVRDLTNGSGNGLVAVNGSVSVSASVVIDNAVNGLPDAWEAQQGLDPLTARATDDNDNDGMPNLMEYAFGGNPKVRDQAQKGPRSEVVDVESHRYLTLSFDRRRQPGALRYSLEESTDMVTWTQVDLNTRLVGSPVIRDAEMETITVKGGQAIDGTGASAKSFMRIRLSNSP